MGYPDVNPVINPNPAAPGSLNKKRIIGAKAFPAELTKPNKINIFVAIINGNNDGKTLLNHSVSPFLAADKTILGKTNKKILKNIISIVIIKVNHPKDVKFLLSEMKIECMFVNIFLTELIAN